MAIKPIDTEVFIQNLKQAYTILRQNILICNTMVEMINNFNSLNDNDNQLTESINEIKQQLAQNESNITQNESDIEDLQSQVGTLDTNLDNLETKVNSNMSKTETAIQTITKDLTKKVTASTNPKIIYGTNLSTPFLYQVKYSDEPTEAGTDTSIPTTAYLWRAITESKIIPNKTEFITQEDGKYALQLKRDDQVLYTDTSINNIIGIKTLSKGIYLNDDDESNAYHLDEQYGNYDIQDNSTTSTTKYLYLDKFKGLIRIRLVESNINHILWIYCGTNRYVILSNNLPQENNISSINNQGSQGAGTTLKLTKDTTHTAGYTYLVVDDYSVTIVNGSQFTPN